MEKRVDALLKQPFTANAVSATAGAMEKRIYVLQTAIHSGHRATAGAMEKRVYALHKPPSYAERTPSAPLQEQWKETHLRFAPTAIHRQRQCKGIEKTCQRFAQTVIFVSRVASEGALICVAQWSPGLAPRCSEHVSGRWRKSASKSIIYY
jgi:hypothetical protein